MSVGLKKGLIFRYRTRDLNNRAVQTALMSRAIAYPWDTGTRFFTLRFMVGDGNQPEKETHNTMVVGDIPEGIDMPRPLPLQ
jgi:hypothetical protein